MFPLGLNLDLQTLIMRIEIFDGSDARTFDIIASATVWVYLYLFITNMNIKATWFIYNWNYIWKYSHLYWRSAAAISVKDSNGTFISTLNLLLYNVSLNIPDILLSRGCCDQDKAENQTHISQ